jgi:GH24 family phage-related lysozyme (muramidase)
MAGDESNPNRKAIALVLATALAVPAEGLRQYAYRDPVGIPTICFGSIQGVHMGDFRTVPECKALLTKEMNDVIETVDKCRPGLPPKILAAFSDAAYNLGEHIACDGTRSTAARMLLQRDYAGACDQLPRWNRARVAGVSVELPGLTKRRLLERDLCLEGVA